MKIVVDSAGYVTIAYLDRRTAESVTRTFCCPVDGGYVREYSSGAQVCERLQNRGSTLTAANRALLPAVIRREYRRMRNREVLQ